jgi:hypothetical protein
MISMSQETAIRALAFVFRASFGRGFPARKAAEISFTVFEMLKIIDWFRVHPSDGQFDIVDEEVRSKHG